MPSKTRFAFTTASSPQRSLLYFLVFLLANCLLAYGRCSMEMALWIGLLGLGLPWIMALKAITPQKGIRSSPKGGWKPAPRFLPFFILILAVVMRFCLSRVLSVWPMWDDGHYGFFAINLSETWHWQLFYGQEQYPPVYTLLQAVFYRFFPPSLPTLWSFPVLVSLGLLPLAYFAARRLFSRWSAVLYIGLWAFSFWPCYISQFSTDIGLCLIWEFAAFLVFCRLMESLGKGKKGILLYSLVLGLMAGVGWYVSKFWLANILVFSISLPYFLRTRGKTLAKPLLFYGVSFLPAFASILWLILTGRYGSHLENYSLFSRALSDGHPWWATSLSYPSALLWGPVYNDYFHFGPLWGGFLNPVLGSAFLLGLLEIYRQKGGPGLWWVCGVLIIYLLPGMASNTLEMMRVAPILPLLLWVAALGVRNLWFLSGPTKILPVVLLAASCALDFYHLGGPYHGWAVPGPHSRDSKSLQRYRAFQVLDQFQDKEGPGVVLTEFVPNVFDQSLLVTTYPFNAARNPSLDPSKARWAALLADDSLEPYLVRQFTHCLYYPLFEGIPSPVLEGNLALYVFPLEGRTVPRIRRWQEVHRHIQSLFNLIPYHHADPDFGPAIGALESCRSLFTGDPFLESCYWDKLASFQASDRRRDAEAVGSLQQGIAVCRSDPSLRTQEGYFLEKLGKEEQSLGGAGSRALQAFEGSYQTGYRTQELYHELVQLEIDGKNYKRALWLVRQAGQWQPQNPPPPGLVQWLLEKSRLPGTPGDQRMDNAR